MSPRRDDVARWRPRYCASRSSLRVSAHTSNCASTGRDCMNHRPAAVASAGTRTAVASDAEKIPASAMAATPTASTATARYQVSSSCPPRVPSDVARGNSASVESRMRSEAGECGVRRGRLCKVATAAADGALQQSCRGGSPADQYGPAAARHEGEQGGQLAFRERADQCAVDDQRIDARVGRCIVRQGTGVEFDDMKSQSWTAQARQAPPRPAAAPPRATGRSHAAGDSFRRARPPP